MKHIYSFYRGFLLLLILLSGSEISQAGHLLGSSIAYEYVGPNMYLVTVRSYRDCQGLSASQSISICYNSVSMSYNNAIQAPMSPGGQFYLPPFPYIPAMPTSCQGGPGLGIERTIYQGLITLPFAASDWVFSYSTYPQNVGINQNFIYVSTKLDNINYPINSSSVFSYDPTFAFCVNQPAWDNFYSLDIDGDSLSYHQIPILDNTTVCPPAPFVNPLQAFSPLQSSTPIQMDSTNGSFTFTPTMAGQAMVSARVDEFRNGVLINSTTIEHVMYLISNCTVTGIDEIKYNTITVHPNPATEVLKLNYSVNEKIVAIEAADVSGKISQLNFIRGNDAAYELDIRNLSNGIYNLRVITENTSVVSKFVKQ